MMMVNTRILQQEFDYFTPKSTQEAISLLSKYGSDAKIIAGGTDLIVQMKLEKVSPVYLINILHIPELNHIEKGNDLRIGAAAKLKDVREFCSNNKEYIALFEAVSVLGKAQVWNMGTIGGNLCNASPSADTAPALLVYKARAKLLSEKGERILDLEEFFKGVNTTAMAPDEIMTEIQIDALSEATGSAFIKVARVGADISKVTCAVAVERDGEACVSCRIALGAVAPVPMRAHETERILSGNTIDASLVKEAGHMVAEEINPIDDVRSTAKYRKGIADVLFRDVFWKAWRRSGGEE